jgi:two-component system, NtrC family, nitrogen regulation sensor histidine kinase NtrY
MGILFEKSEILQKNSQNYVHGFSENIESKRERLHSHLNSLLDFYPDALFGFDYKEIYEQEGIALFIIGSSDLVFWSTNSVPLTNNLEIAWIDEPVIRLQNGWYLSAQITKGDTAYLGLSLIKNEFEHQNQYLKDKFHPDFDLPDDVQITLNQSLSQFLVKDTEGSFICGLNFGKKKYPSFLQKAISILCYLLFFLFALAAFYTLARRSRSKWISLASFIIIAVIIRALMIQLNFPGILYELPLFSPVFYATSVVFPSLGDLLINVLLILFTSFVYVGFIKPHSNQNSGKWRIIILFIFFLSAWLLGYLTIGLIKNSNIPLNLTNIFELNYLSFIALLICGFLLLSFLLVSYNTVLFNSKNKKDKSLPIIIVLFAFYTIANVLSGVLLPVVLMLPLAIYWVLYAIVKKPEHFSFSNSIIIILLFSLYLSEVFSVHLREKEKVARQTLVQKIARENDPIAEFLFRAIEPQIVSNLDIEDFLDKEGYKREELELYLKAHYFNGYWEKYDLQATLCNEEDYLLVDNDKRREHCFDFFNQVVHIYGKSVLGNRFFFLNNNTGRISYLVRIPILFSGQDSPVLFIELDSKFVPEGTGYPELLMDISQLREQPDKKNYSYAKYKNNRLVSKSGIYSYPVSQENAFPVIENDFAFETLDDFEHLFYAPDENTLIILSKPNEIFLNTLSYFSYLFAFLSLFFLVILIIRQFPKGYINLFNDFKGRIQGLLIITVLLAIAFFGGGTVFYIENQYKFKNKSIISEKMRSVQTELEHKLDSEEALTPEMENLLSYYLVKFSNVFYSDINLYNAEGNLLASSRPEIFNTGLSGRKMNSTAFKVMAIENRTEFIQRENIGKLNYLSAYVPFFNVNGKLLAYLNLPYFSKQDELEKEISLFLSALINIYVLLFVLSVIFAVFISGYIIKPLELIRNKIRNVRLGTANEMIEWKSDDEIGNLVKEYNRMISELSESAEKLAKSERESAWREMARQVAHEIKNPLTPMKLSIQHLIRAKNDNAPDFDKKLEKISATLVEQIDALANIAGEFSNFANMPKPNVERIELKNLIHKAIDLYHGTDKISIMFRQEVSKPVYVNADKDQLLRVFNNLIKNSVQSIPESGNGVIEIKLDAIPDKVIISVKDNGTGIPYEMKERIFVPNFTTKTGGMGLGLAMVKNIIESSGGKIEFESETGVGTTFYISLPYPD